MSYEKQNFIKGQTLKADHLNYMEDGISQLSEEVEELKENGTADDGSVTPEQIQQAVDSYLTANPIQENDPTVPDWAKRPEKPTYTAQEVGALPADAEIVDQTARQGVAENTEAISQLSEEIGAKCVTQNKTVNLFDWKFMAVYGSWFYFTSRPYDVGGHVELITSNSTRAYTAVDIPISDESTVTISTNNASTYIYSWFAVNDEGTVLAFASGQTSATGTIGNGFSITIPEGATHLYLSLYNALDISTGKSWMMVNSGGTALPYEDYNGEMYLSAHGIRLATYDDLKAHDKTNIKLELPDKFCAVVGDTIEIFYKGIINAVNPDLYYVEIDCDIGSVYAKKYVCNPTASQIGDHTMTFCLYDQEHTQLDEKQVTLSVKAKLTASPTDEVVVLYVGDSLASGGYVPGEFKRRLTASDGYPQGDGLSNITFIGSCNANGVDYEGYGGYSFEKYITDGKGNNHMWITAASHGKTDDDQHSIYQADNGTKWKLETIEAGRIKLIRYGSGTLPVTGMLTWVSGGVNRGNIVYTASEQAVGNPFWSETAGKNDFAAYAQQLGKNKIDYVYVLLGWNDAPAEESAYKYQARRFFTDIHSAFPDCKVVYLGLQIPARDGLGANYAPTSVYSRYYEMMQHVFKLNDWYADLVADYPDHISVVNVAGQFDTENNMMTAERPVNVRNATAETYQSNGVHPATDGYYQIADACYRDFIHKLQS